jgi:hypothetical protein
MVIGTWLALLDRRTGTQQGPGVAYLQDLKTDLGPQGLAQRVAQAAERLMDRSR